MINGRTRLHVVANGTMTGQRHIDEVLFPRVRLFRGAVGDKFVFMDDNATCHRTLAVQDCLDSEGIQRLVWPVYSPDLNPIENVWDALGRQVAGRNYPPTNKNTLIRALTEEWDKLPHQLLDNVVQNMKRRTSNNLRGHGGLVTKTTNSLLACPEFEPSAAEDPPCRGAHFSLNMLRIKCLTVGVMWNGQGSGLLVCVSRVQASLKTRRAGSDARQVCQDLKHPPVGVVVRRGECQFWCRPRPFTMVLRQKPSSSFGISLFALDLFCSGSASGKSNHVVVVHPLLHVLQAIKA
ncbi:transposable element Tcb2 transposase [Trichonephila clavipes]|uniref:Transposable element Tcb2 transposase n=1 Tax=Trichonephila clavipes TaxID=2585209 RepID=A0A8X6W3C2_TRICX|nr:transposable element Tcb2 transposase [Trichonephila clavipes]